VPLDPQVDAFLQQVAAEGGPPLTALTPDEARLGPYRTLALGGEADPIGPVREHAVAVDGATITVRTYTPPTPGPHPIVVFFHGGGWVICDLDTHDTLCRMLCAGADAVVASVGYRLAPEHRFPTAPHDAFAGLQWVVTHARELGGDPARVALCGDSAGGNLSAVVSQMARDRGGPALAFTALIYPATDMTADDDAMRTNATGYFLETADMEWFMGHYLDETQRADPLASPARATSHAGLPPCFITTCEYDPLRDQGERYGALLAAAGVPVEVKRYDGMVHAVAVLGGVIDGGRRMVDDVADRLRLALHGSGVR
jgi:acetyl esterase